MLFGHPRNDIFFRADTDKIRHQTLTMLGLPDDRKYILYAPTYRDSLRIDCYDIDYRGMVAALKDRFGGEWTVLVRLHPTVRMIPELQPPSDIAVDVCSYPDIQELMVAADAMVTDYSSCIFDYLLSGKPGFVFAVDLEKQNRERGFYYPLETTPFPIGLNSQELCANIRTFDAEKFASDTQAFLASKGCMEDGKASARVVDLIETELGIKSVSCA
jgi:CDP-glycerol glycerophosphotransferase